MARFYMYYKKGQATVLVLLLAMLGLTIVLSVSSRSLSDLKQATYVDSGTRALGYAEAGLQYALSQNTTPPTAGGCIAETDIKSALNISGLQSATYTVCSGSTNVVFIPSVPGGQMAQVDISGMNPMNTKALNFFWQGDASMEIIYLSKDDTMVRYGYNPYGSSKSGSNGMTNGYSAVTDVTNCPTGCTNDVAYTSCSGNITHTANDSLIRIKTFYKSSPIIACAITSGGSVAKDMPMDYVTVTATVKITDGTTKKVQALRFPPALPSVFDDAIFTTLPLTK